MKNDSKNLQHQSKSSGHFKIKIEGSYDKRTKRSYKNQIFQDFAFKSNVKIVKINQHFKILLSSFRLGKVSNIFLNSMSIVLVEYVNLNGNFICVAWPVFLYLIREISVSSATTTKAEPHRGLVQNLCDLCRTTIIKHYDIFCTKHLGEEET
ncbi:CLUMA_CG016616, isoform A [Clunio marinus]|uniref:CLUMA_CG016616, isoform A n=1 Tax=Clunio marinus TaxID=568069 RepID=A0A1J1ISS5_9DIPT|nr:CLUMA_CG016616, isoform A [Clunio marinus]